MAEKKEKNPKGKAIFDRIISTLDKYGQNRLEMCESLGIKSQNITSMNYSLPAVDTVVEIARYLKVSVEYLVTGEDSARPDISGAIKKIGDGLEHLKQVEDLRKVEILSQVLDMKIDAAKARSYLNGDLDAGTALKTGKEGLDAGEIELLAAYGCLTDVGKTAAINAVKGLSASFAKKGADLSDSEIA
jgi:hypothetical protein